LNVRQAWASQSHQGFCPFVHITHSVHARQKWYCDGNLFIGISLKDEVPAKMQAKCLPHVDRCGAAVIKE
jgi:hypothetical protein